MFCCNVLQTYERRFIMHDVYDILYAMYGVILFLNYSTVINYLLFKNFLRFCYSQHVFLDFSFSFSVFCRTATLIFQSMQLKFRFTLFSDLCVQTIIGTQNWWNVGLLSFIPLSVKNLLTILFYLLKFLSFFSHCCSLIQYLGEEFCLIARSGKSRGTLV